MQNRHHNAPLVVFAVLVSIGLVGCSTSSQPTTAGSSTSASHQVRHVAVTSTTQLSPATTTTLPKPSLGDVVYKAEDTTCGTDTSGDQLSVQGSQAVPGRRIVLYCGVQGYGVSPTSSGSVYIVPVNNPDDKIETDFTDAQVYVGAAHYYILYFNAVPATALNGKYFTETLSQFDYATGNQNWSEQIETNAKSKDESCGATSVSVTESPQSTVAGHGELLVLCNNWSLLDSATGKTLTDGSTSPVDGTLPGSYVGYGIAVTDGSSGDSGEERVGTDLLSAKQRWDIHFPPSGTSQESPFHKLDPDGTYWEIDSGGMVAYNLITGQLVTQQAFPAAWKDYDQNQLIANTRFAVTAADNTLTCYKLSDLQRPVWQVDADSAKTVALSDTQVVIQGPNGFALVSLSDGSITPTGVTGVVATGAVVVDGLFQVDNQFIEAG